MKTMKMKTILFLCFFHAASSWVPEMENPNMHEGDIVITPVDRKSNGYASIIGGRWPNNIVPYTLNRMYSGNHGNVLRAIDEYHKYTCLKFVPRTNQDTYLSFFPGSGCSSPVGYYRGRINDVSLANGCLSLGTVVHEIGHSIGLYHEQSRPDRDDYVTIIWNNIQSGMAYNFDKFDRRTIDSMGFGYDYYSVMHYGETAFGGNRITMQTKDPSKQKVIGSAKTFSAGDIQQINKMYNCQGGGNPPTAPPTLPPGPNYQCKAGQDLDDKCSGWANTGYCKSTDRNYLEIMKRKCCKSCQDTCSDKDTNCPRWAQSGECEKNPNWMLQNCSKSCFKCN